MDADEMRQLVGDARVARLATLDAAGRPHLVPITYALEGDVLYTAVDRKPKRSPRLKRLANVRARPDVSVLVDHYEDDWSRLWWVRLDGRAHVVEDGPELERALTLLAQKYEQYRAQPPPGPAIVVAIEDWSGWKGAGG